MWFRLDSKLVQSWSRFGRLGADSVPVLVQTWFRFGTDLAQIWRRCGSDLVQTWFRFGSGLVLLWVRFGSYLTQLWIVRGSDVVWVGYSQGPGSTADHGQQDFNEILTCAHTTCWHPHGETIIAKAVLAGFDPTEVEDEVKSPWASRHDSRSGAPWPPSGSSGRPPAPRVLQRTDTEEELRRLKNRQELYGLRKQLHEQEVQDAARNQNRTEAREQSMAASIRLPQAPAAPPSVLAVLRDTLPLPAVRQAQSATHLGARLGEPIEASESLVNQARLAQQARLTPPSGQNESQEGQAMVGKSEVAT